MMFTRIPLRCCLSISKSTFAVSEFPRRAIELKNPQTKNYCNHFGYGSNSRTTWRVGQLSHSHASFKTLKSSFSTSSKYGFSYSNSVCDRESSSVRVECENEDISMDLRISGLPEAFVMKLSGHGSLQVNHLEEHQYDSALNLVQAAIERGDNVGIAELPDNREHLRRFLGYTSAFALSDADGRMQALVFIESCFGGYFRSVRPHTATVHLITSDKLSSDLSRLRDLARLTAQLTARLKRGYGACAIGVYFTCVKWYQAFRLEGWVAVACIQRAGTVTGMEGYIPSYVMIKELPRGGKNDELNKESMKRICRYANQLVNYSCHSNNSDTQLIQSFPMNCVLNDGTRIRLRNARSDESKKFFEIFNNGGYGLDEFPTQEFFNEFIFRQSFNIVVEENACNNVEGDSVGKRQWMSVIMISDTGYSRCHFYPKGHAHPVCDIYYAAVGKHAKGKGFGSQLVDISTRISKDLGYLGYHGDVSMENIASARLSYTLGFTFCGVIPKSVRYADKGWTDSAIVYSDVTQLKSFLPFPNSTKVDRS